VHIDRIEFEQKLFLLFILRGLNWDQNVSLPAYSSRLLLINLPNLVNRRKKLGTVFMHNLIKGDIDSVDLVSLWEGFIPIAFKLRD